MGKSSQMTIYQVVPLNVAITFWMRKNRLLMGDVSFFSKEVQKQTRGSDLTLCSSTFREPTRVVQESDEEATLGEFGMVPFSWRTIVFFQSV